ncbi:Pathogen-associated molecular patterns-induced protein A70 [Euphorbia peplus]|nr:Pathogen-associated molecular patterns-induced protein A70 [Euphorbia peplus]
MPDISSSSSAAWNFATTFSPATLFVLLNMVIGTIFLSSHFTPKRKPPQEDDHHHHQPSLIDRVKSINYSFRKSSPEFQDNGDTTEADHPPPAVVQRAAPLLQRLKSVKLSSFYRGESNAGEPEPEPEQEVAEQPHHVERSKSEQRTTADRTGAARMKRWASEKAVKMEEYVEEEEERERVERRRPETVRLGKTTSFGDDEEGSGVDAKADDFISKFKQQLKLQRLDSLLRYRDMFK